MRVRKVVREGKPHILACNSDRVVVQCAVDGVYMIFMATNWYGGFRPGDQKSALVIAARYCERYYKLYGVSPGALRGHARSGVVQA